MIPQFKNEKLNNPDLVENDNIKNFFTPLIGNALASLGKCFYYKKNKEVTVHFGINLGTAARSKIFTLPEGFRPTGTVVAWGGGADGTNLDKSFVEIWGNTGEIYVTSPSKYSLIDIKYDAFQ